MTSTEWTFCRQVCLSKNATSWVNMFPSQPALGRFYSTLQFTTFITLVLFGWASICWVSLNALVIHIPSLCFSSSVPLFFLGPELFSKKLKPPAASSIHYSIFYCSEVVMTLPNSTLSIVKWTAPCATPQCVSSYQAKADSNNQLSFEFLPHLTTFCYQKIIVDW